nr:hypothetical protein [Iodobacter fluviatilis]
MSESQLQARTDPLTGLLNRRSLENQAARALALPEQLVLLLRILIILSV